jgi:uncharacterized membrane protein
MCKAGVAIIGAAVITVPLLPFFSVVDEIFLRWQCQLFVALVLLANLALTRFTERIAKNHRSRLQVPAEEAVRAPDASHERSEPSPGQRHWLGALRLTIREFMIGIAVIAVEFVLLRTFLNDVSSLGGEERFFWDIVQWFYAGVLLLMPLTFGLTMFLLLRPGEPAGTLLRKPGAIACFLATAILFAVGYVLAISYVKEPIRPWAGTTARLQYWFVIVAEAPVAIGLLILASWNLLALGGQWKRGQTRLERASRLVGRGWIVCALIDAIVIPVTIFIYFFSMFGLA